MIARVAGMDFALTDEQIMFKVRVLKFARWEIVGRVQEHDLKSQFDFQSGKKLGEFGILVHFPEQFGGGGADVITSVLAAEALGVGRRLMLSYGAHTYLCVDTIFSHGTEIQKRKYIPRLASGEWIGCMGLTEHGRGLGRGIATWYSGEKEQLLGVERQQDVHHQWARLADVAVIYA